MLPSSFKPGLSAMAGGVVLVVVLVLSVEVEEEVRVKRCDVRVDEIHGCYD
jgi:hypothetical protein